MRRNLVEGKCEIWRLFMNDENNLLQHAQVQVNRYWNEEFLVVTHYKKGALHDIFVWKWHKCQKPVFLYGQNLLSTYPDITYPFSVFISKNFFVLIPYRDDQNTSMVRVHDLSDGFKLVGKFDCDEDSNLRISHNPELTKLGDEAVVLCQVHDLTFFIFSIPDCKLERSFKIKDYLETSYDLMDIDQSFMRENTWMLLFRDPDNFDPWEDETRMVQNGILLNIDFDDFLQKKGDIKFSENHIVDIDIGLIEAISLSKTQLTCILMSGNIVVKNLSSPKDLLTIEAPERMNVDTTELEQEDSDWASLCCGPGGDLIIAYRHFDSGSRKIHAYNRVGNLLYEIRVDDPKYKLELREGCISVALKGRLLNDLL